MCRSYRRRAIRKSVRPEFWAGNGRANFTGAWHCWKTPMPIKFLLLGGGGVLVFFRGGGRSANLIFTEELQSLPSRTYPSGPDPL